MIKALADYRTKFHTARDAVLTALQSKVPGTSATFTHKDFKIFSENVAITPRLLHLHQYFLGLSMLPYSKLMFLIASDSKDYTPEQFLDYVLGLKLFQFAPSYAASNYIQSEKKENR